MERLSSIALVTVAGDQITLTASGIKTDPLRVLLMTEADYVDAMRSVAAGGRLTGKSIAMPILSTDRPTVTLKMPSAGNWRIVYQTADADSVTAEIR